MLCRHHTRTAPKGLWQISAHLTSPRWIFIVAFFNSPEKTRERNNDRVGSAWLYGKHGSRGPVNRSARPDGIFILPGVFSHKIISGCECFCGDLLKKHQICVYLVGLVGGVAKFRGKFGWIKIFFGNLLLKFLLILQIRKLVWVLWFGNNEIRKFFKSW